MFVFKRQRTGFYDSGTYQPVHTSKGVHIDITCPGCGRVIHLTDYEIRARGLVFPEIHCTGSQCGWQGFGRLEGWRDDAR